MSRQGYMTEWDEDSLQAALAEALEEKEKAAEYGLQLLHRNNHLEQCKEQLETQIAQMRNSYDELKQTHTQLTETHGRMCKSFDQHDQSILSESEDREISLIEERDQLRNQVKRLKKTEKKMKNKITELNGQVVYLGDEIEKHKMTHRTNAEQMRALRAKEKNFEADYRDLVQEICQLQKEMGELKQRENKATGLIELNESLRHSYEQKRIELQDVQQVYQSTKAEYKQVLAALEAEREAKELYQSKLEESLRSDDTDDEISDIPTKIIGPPHRLNSPPLSSVAHELAAELEQSIQLSVIDLEEQLESVTDEKSRLSDIVEQHKRELSNSQELLTIKDLECRKLESTLQENIKQLSEKEEIEMRFYVIQESHQNMINDLSKDIIKLKQANNSLKTAEFLSHETIMQLRSDIDVMEARYFESNSQGLINDLRNELHILRDRERVLLQTITSLKSDLSRENDEKLTAMYIELRTLFKDLCILKRFSSSHSQQSHEDEESDENWLLAQHINTDKVVALLKEQVTQLKSTINSILMSQVLDSGLIKTEHDLESFKQIILLQNEEQKSIGEVKSGYERDLSILRESNTELKCRNKQLERDKMEWDSLRKVFDMKCEEYIVEVGIMEKRLRESDRERNTLQQLLQQIIQDKIELKQKIESFEIDLETTWTKNQSLYAKFDSNQNSASVNNNQCDSSHDTTTNSCDSISNLNTTIDSLETESCTDLQLQAPEDGQNASNSSEA
ncbi:hypothetical protein ACHWQZ_G003939 [Mnemiopsis leidyi]